MFLDFIEVERITGRELAGAILHSLRKWDLPLCNLRGQCYDGASNMAGSRSGCSDIVQQHCPMALYTHCAAHQLNPAVVSACKIQECRNAESFIGEAVRFFNYSAKRQRVLDQTVDLLCLAQKSKKLKDACRTRWIDRIDSYVVFLEILPAVVMALHAMVSPNQFDNIRCDWNWDGETIAKASGFLHHIESPSFLITFKILLEVLANLRGLTLKLQMQAGDVFYAYKQVTAIVDSLKEMRRKSERGFTRIFKEATKLGKDLHGEDFDLSMPRINRRQVHRSNVQTQSAEDYFRITIYNEFLSHVISELQVDLWTAKVTALVSFISYQVSAVALMKMQASQKR